jgi:hypothetical protein
MTDTIKLTRVPTRMLSLRQKQHNRKGQIIDAAYALVQSVYGDDMYNPTSDAGHRAWEKPDVQKAAMDAATAFIDTLEG